MSSTTIAILLYGLFAAAFWAALCLVPGRIGRKTFFFGVNVVTLTGWFVIADTAATAGSLGVALGIGMGVALVTGFVTGALSVGFARWLNRSRRFAWTALVPFALPIMALMDPRPAPTGAA